MKFPHIEYDPVLGGINGESAIEVYKFLADEASFEGDKVKAALFHAKVKNLSSVVPASVSDRYIDEAIAKYGRKKAS